MLVLSIEILPKMFVFICINTSLSSTKIPEVITANVFINVTTINNIFQEFTCLSITK